MLFVKLQALQRTDGGIDGRVHRAVGAAAIPTAVGRLLVEQVRDDGFEPRVVILEIRQDGQDHPGHAGLAALGPLGPIAVIDPAVRLQSAIQLQLASNSRPRVVLGQTKSRSSNIVYVVDVHFGEYSPPSPDLPAAHLPPRS